MPLRWSEVPGNRWTFRFATLMLNRDWFAYFFLHEKSWNLVHSMVSILSISVDILWKLTNSWIAKVWRGKRALWMWSPLCMPKSYRVCRCLCLLMRFGTCECSSIILNPLDSTHCNLPNSSPLISGLCSASEIGIWLFEFFLVACIHLLKEWLVGGRGWKHGKWIEGASMRLADAYLPCFYRLSMFLGRAARHVLVGAMPINMREDVVTRQLHMYIYIYMIRS